MSNRIEYRRFERIRRVERITSILVVAVVGGLIALVVWPRVSTSSTPKVRVEKPATAE